MSSFLWYALIISHSPALCVNKLKTDCEASENPFFCVRPLSLPNGSQLSQRASQVGAVLKIYMVLASPAGRGGIALAIPERAC